MTHFSTKNDRIDLRGAVENTVMKDRSKE